MVQVSTETFTYGNWTYSNCIRSKRVFVKRELTKHYHGVSRTCDRQQTLISDRTSSTRPSVVRAWYSLFVITTTVVSFSSSQHLSGIFTYNRNNSRSGLYRYDKPRRSIRSMHGHDFYCFWGRWNGLGIDILIGHATHVCTIRVRATNTRFVRAFFLIAGL